MNQQLAWDEAVGRLKSRVTPQNYDMWLRPIEVTSWDGATLRLRAPNSYIRFWFESNFLQSLVKELRDLGHVEGKNVVIEFRTTGGKSGRYPELADELVRLKQRFGGSGLLHDR